MCVNAWINVQKDVSALEIGKKNMCSIASAVLRGEKTITIEKFTNVEPKVYFSFFDTTYLPLFCKLIEVSWSSLVSAFNDFFT